MTSRMRLKLQVRQGEAKIAELEKKLAYEEGRHVERDRREAQLQQSYTVLRTKWEQLNKTYAELGNLWNSFQGTVSLPTEAELNRRRAQGELISGVARKLIEVFLPQDQPKAYDPRRGY